MTSYGPKRTRKPAVDPAVIAEATAKAAQARHDLLAKLRDAHVDHMATRVPQPEPELVVWSQSQCLACSRYHGLLWPPCTTCPNDMHTRQDCSLIGAPTYDPDKVACGKCGAMYWLMWVGGATEAEPLRIPMTEEN